MLYDKALIDFLNRKADEYDQPFFIKTDPVCIPHLFAEKQDIEIAGFFAAIFAWGNRTTIINKSKELLQLMDNSPHQFVTQHQEKDLKNFLGFKHRTFNTTDLLYFIQFFKYHYSKSRSLETAFFNKSSLIKSGNASSYGEGLVEAGLNYFYNYFFSLQDAPQRTWKHIASPAKNSSCKRLNMFLRWMVRQNSKVDFGIWKTVSPADLICPLDVHVARVARHFKLLERKNTDWKATIELAENLNKLDAKDPAKYDYALFGLGVMEKF